MGHTCCPIRGRDRLLPYLVLLQAGFAVPPSVATGAVRSYRTLSPLPPPLQGVGGLLSVALSVGSRPPGVTWRLALGARTFLHACAQRLPGRLRPRWWWVPGEKTRGKSAPQQTSLAVLRRSVSPAFFSRHRVELAALAAGEAGGDFRGLRRRKLFAQYAQ